MTGQGSLVVLVVLALARETAWSAPRELVTELETIRVRIAAIERAEEDDAKKGIALRSRIERQREANSLRRKELEIGRLRLGQMESIVSDLLARKEELESSVAERKSRVRRALGWIARASGPDTQSEVRADLTAPLSRTLALISARAARDIETLRADAADVARLQAKLEEERNLLAHTVEDQREKAEILAVEERDQRLAFAGNEAIRRERMARIRKLREAEAQVQGLLAQISARRELERASDEVLAGQPRAGLALLKGKLPLPVRGVVSKPFGRVFDPTSGLSVYRKGVEISSPAGSQVAAIADGKVAFVGELPDLGRVMILDHGSQYYSLLGHLGHVERTAGDAIRAGERIASSESGGAPVYFEIRARNVPVNPLQWVSGSFTF